MSHPGQNTSLSLPARLLCYLGPPSAILLTSVASPRTGLIAPLTFLHTGWLYKNWRDSNQADPSSRGELEPLIWTGVLSTTVGLGAVVLAQAAVGYAASTALFGNGEIRDSFLKEAMRSSINGLTADELSRRAELAYSWKNLAFNALFSFGVAGVFEETLKYLPILYARHRENTKEKKRRNGAYLDYVLAGSLSFTIVESIGFLYASVEHGQESWPKLALTIFERIGIGSTGHLLVAALTALRAIRRDYYGDKMSWWGVVGPAMLLHGLFDFGAFSFSASDGNVGFIHPTAPRKIATMLSLAVGMQCISGWLVRREYKIIGDHDAKRE